MQCLSLDLCPSLQAQHGLINVTTDSTYLIYQQNQNGEYEVTYWDTIDEDGTELLNIGGSLLKAQPDGVQVNGIPYLALTSVTPVSNSTIASGEIIRLQFTVSK